MNGQSQRGMHVIIAGPVGEGKTTSFDAVKQSGMAISELPELRHTDTRARIKTIVIRTNH